MQKVIIIGSEGAGKSTFSRAFGNKMSLPVIHLDAIFGNRAGRRKSERYLKRGFGLKLKKSVGLWTGILQVQWTCGCSPVIRSFFSTFLAGFAYIGLLNDVSHITESLDLIWERAAMRSLI
ncbi:hypothetical protein [Litoribacterium kuwaitense]|uniref:hypothetical protein n=1 Tax=Litoribacterium kuwaitense TaxID=1398745 RepID=UPI0028A9674F|nr:hypothetical protein [Litoribacterium kuwaitense]